MCVCPSRIRVIVGLAVLVLAARWLANGPCVLSSTPEPARVRRAASLGQRGPGRAGGPELGATMQIVERRHQPKIGLARNCSFDMQQSGPNEMGRIDSRFRFVAPNRYDLPDAGGRSQLARVSSAAAWPTDAPNNEQGSGPAQPAAPSPGRARDDANE